MTYGSLAPDPSYAGQKSHGVAFGSLAFGEHDASTLPLNIATAEHIMVSRTVDFRAFPQQVDTVIEANSAAQVIPSAEAIAAEVLRQQEHKHTEERGTGVFRDLWKEHRNKADMVRHVGLAYRDCDDGGLKIDCPLCQTKGGKEGNGPIATYPKLRVRKKAIGRHMLKCTWPQIRHTPPKQTGKHPEANQPRGHH